MTEVVLEGNRNQEGPRTSLAITQARYQGKEHEAIFVRLPCDSASSDEGGRCVSRLACFIVRRDRTIMAMFQTA